MRTYVVKAWSFDPEACDYYTVKAYSEEEAINIGFRPRSQLCTRPES